MHVGGARGALAGVVAWEKEEQGGINTIASLLPLPPSPSPGVTCCCMCHYHCQFYFNITSSITVCNTTMYNYMHQYKCEVHILGADQWCRCQSWRLPGQHRLLGREQPPDSRPEAKLYILDKCQQTPSGEHRLLGECDNCLPTQMLGCPQIIHCG